MTDQDQKPAGGDPAALLAQFFALSRRLSEAAVRIAGERKVASDIRSSGRAPELGIERRIDALEVSRLAALSDLESIMVVLAGVVESCAPVMAAVVQARAMAAVGNAVEKARADGFIVTPENSSNGAEG